MSLFKPTKPSKRVGTNNWQFTRRIDKSLHGRIAGHRLQVILPAQGQDEALSIDKELVHVISFSLGTREARIASTRCNIVDRELMRLIDIIQSRRIHYTDDEIEEFAKRVYAFYKERYIDSTGLPNEAKTLNTLVEVPYDEQMKLMPLLVKKHKDLQYWQIWIESFHNGYRSTDVSPDAIEFRVGTLTNWWMFEVDMRLPYEDRLRLTAKVDQIARHNEYNSLQSTLIKKNVVEEISSSEIPVVSFDSILDAWRLDQTSHETIKKRGLAIKSLKASCGFDNANAVTITHLLNWRTELKDNPKLSAITVNRIYIAGIKAVFSYAFSIDMIRSDQTKRLKVIKEEQESDEGKPYTNREVITFASAAQREADPIVKYIVLLLVATGARIGEIAMLGLDQIHMHEVGEHDNPSWIEIRNSSFGGKLKTQKSRRNIPITKFLIKDDFFDFVQTRKGKPLFYDHVTGWRGKGQQHDKIRFRTGPWLRKFPKSDPEIDTHHGFRHWIYTRAGDKRVRREYVNDFARHAREGAQGRYGDRKKVIVLSEEMEPVFNLFSDLHLSKS